MLKLIPAVKTLEIKQGYLSKKAIFFDNSYDNRLVTALSNLPVSNDGVEVKIEVCGNVGEGYELEIGEAICIKADSLAGAFYAIQTLRQVFLCDKVPYLYIKDYPDFEYRGFYHDVTRGKVPTVDTIKKLIDRMAYYKMNSLQLYVEHTSDLKEYKDLNEKTGFLSGEELKELGKYCEQNFIDFIPSLSTFGHLNELLNQEKYKHLRVIKNEIDNPNFWRNRMVHHTIDPLMDESIDVIKSLIDQFSANFDSNLFNICGDETFDLKIYDEQGYDSGRLYVDFIKKIIDHVQSKGKTVMMWADILLKHPETIDQMPDDIYYLNWNYRAQPPEENIIKFAQLGRKQIVCPGTSSWSRLCEDVAKEEKNISLMAEYGYKHGAVGVLNTNWGDWGNPCSIELATYGMVLGAEKSWSVNTKINGEFYDRINTILYEEKGAIEYLIELSKLHEMVDWNGFAQKYFCHRYNYEYEFRPALNADLKDIQNAYKDFYNRLSKESWKNDEYRQEMLISAKGVCLIAEFAEKLNGQNTEHLINTKEWLSEFSEKWLLKNKPSELSNIVEMFTYCEQL